jgi:hypothetical protein
LLQRITSSGKIQDSPKRALTCKVQPPKAQSPMIAQAHVLDENKPNLESVAV